MSKETFDFSEALRRMKQGKRVKRKVWRHISYAYVKSNIILYHTISDFGSLDIVYSDFDCYVDKLATDWKEVEE